MRDAKTFLLIASAALALAGCAGHGCFVGFSVFPPSPVILCGFDVEPAAEKGGE